MAISLHVFTRETAFGNHVKSGCGSSRRYHLKVSDWQFLAGDAALSRWISWPPLWSQVLSLYDVTPLVN
jgi:hypothetical protein